MRRMSIIISALVAVAVPVAYALSGYLALNNDLAFKAQLNAERIARYAYGRPQAWPYAVEHLKVLITLTGKSNAAVRQQVCDANGVHIVDTTPNLAPPLMWQRRPILVRGEVVGSVGVGTSLWPLLFSTMAAMGVGLMIGALSWLVMRRLPQRSLEQSLAAIHRSHEKTHRQAASLTAVNNELNTQYQYIAETARRLEQARKDAEVANRSKSTFLATMSHELRTPLTAIIGFADMMESGVFGKIEQPNYSEYVRDINRSGHHLLSIINNMLDLSKVEAGRMELRPELVSVPDLLEDSVGVLETIAADAGVTLALSVADDLPRVRADEVKIKQVLLNLLSNAIKFTPPNGRVTASADLLDGDHVRVTVTDTGIGMATDELTHAMEPFRQVENPMTTKHFGTGLGLPVSKALVELHGGHFGLASVKGTGTTATITLPINGPKGGTQGPDAQNAEGPA
ncbi:Signal transduction histidine kinase [Rhodospira trueperi]|uniref:histidine kinase n=2 Tax=Rhodospira trueperi TaxID=69960 RepID=A0A1G6WIP8_9PROT|nr:Signal transduction histidine kinase [Rhodospira trueperi]